MGVPDGTMTLILSLSLGQTGPVQGFRCICLWFQHQPITQRILEFTACSNLLLEYFFTEGSAVLPMGLRWPIDQLKTMPCNQKRQSLVFDHNIHHVCWHCHESFILNSSEVCVQGHSNSFSLSQVLPTHGLSITTCQR